MEGSVSTPTPPHCSSVAAQSDSRGRYANNWMFRAPLMCVQVAAGATLPGATTPCVPAWSHLVALLGRRCVHPAHARMEVCACGMD